MKMFHKIIRENTGFISEIVSLIIYDPALLRMDQSVVQIIKYFRF